MFKYFSLFILGIMLIINAGCSNKDTEKLAETQKILATAVSLEKDIMPIFKRSCAVCHNRQNQSSPATEHGVYYDTIEDITNEIGKHIVTGRPGESTLYNICAQEITVSDEDLVMPPPGSGIPKWSQSDLKKFAKWIAAGALNN